MRSEIFGRRKKSKRRRKGLWRRQNRRKGKNVKLSL
jgi:hypothetical protein